MDLRVGVLVLTSRQVEVDQLRVQCADYIEQHQKDLLPFLIDPETGETFTGGKRHA